MTMTHERGAIEVSRTPGAGDVRIERILHGARVVAAAFEPED